VTCSRVERNLLSSLTPIVLSLHTQKGDSLPELFIPYMLALFKRGDFDIMKEVSLCFDSHSSVCFLTLTGSLNSGPPLVGQDLQARGDG